MIKERKQKYCPAKEELTQTLSEFEKSFVTKFRIESEKEVLNEVDLEELQFQIDKVKKAVHEEKKKDLIQTHYLF